MFLNPCAVSSFQVCRQFLLLLNLVRKNEEILDEINKTALFLGLFKNLLVLSVPPNFFQCLVCRQHEKVENHCLSAQLKSHGGPNFFLAIPQGQIVAFLSFQIKVAFIKLKAHSFGLSGPN